MERNCTAKTCRQSELGSGTIVVPLSTRKGCVYMYHLRPLSLPVSPGLSVASGKVGQAVEVLWVPHRTLMNQRRLHSYSLFELQV